MATLTGASATIFLSVSGLFPTPVQIQGFAADDVYDIENQDITETAMGVDGVLSGGFVWVAVRQTFAIQADSPSNTIFDQWAAQQRNGLDAFVASAIVNIVATGVTYHQQRGFLTNYSPAPAVKKLLQPRKHTITWQTILPQPI